MKKKLLNVHPGELLREEFLNPLGITAYQMFTGKLPFEHPELLPLLMKHLNEQPTPPRTIVPALPENLEAVILKLIEKKGANRYQSCAEAAQAFDAVLKSLPK